MSVIDSSAEIQKLAHQLGVPPARLEFLAAVDADELRTLRRQIGDVLFNVDKHHFSKVVAVSKIIPAALAAKITERALSPLIAARTAELLEPARAADMVARLSDGYLADVSAAMDPARAPEVIAQIPAKQVAIVGTELARRGEWVVMGGFVSLVSHEALRAAVRCLTGDQLLRVGFVLDDLARLDDIAQMLTDDQVDDLLAAAVEHDLWPELDELLAHLDSAQSQRLAARYAAAGPAVAAAADEGALSEASRARLGSR
jgi:hypothetical protein